MNIINKSKGFTLVEILLVLTVIMALTVSVFLIYQKVSNEQKIKTEVETLMEIVASVKYFYSFSTDYKGLDNDFAIKNKLVPESLISSDNVSILNSYDVPVFIKAYGAGVSPSKLPYSSFYIMYYDTKSKRGIPVDACVKIVSRVQNSFYEVKVGQNIVKSNFWGQVIKFNIDQLEKSCEAKNASIQFVAY